MAEIDCAKLGSIGEKKVDPSGISRNPRRDDTSNGLCPLSHLYHAGQSKELTVTFKSSLNTFRGITVKTATPNVTQEAFNEIRRAKNRKIKWSKEKR